MSRDAPKRRLRIRRKRRGVAGEPAGQAGGEAVFQLGCCVVEAVGSLAVLIGLLFVPTYLLLS